MAQIVTFSTFGAKQAIRDVFKRFGTPEYELTNLTKRIGLRDTLSSAYEKNLAFRQAIQSRPEYRKGFEIAKRIEGNRVRLDSCGRSRHEWRRPHQSNPNQDG